MVRPSLALIPRCSIRPLGIRGLSSDLGLIPRCSFGPTGYGRVKPINLGLIPRWRSRSALDWYFGRGMIATFFFSYFVDISLSLFTSSFNVQTVNMVDKTTKGFALFYLYLKTCIRNTRLSWVFLYCLCHYFSVLDGWRHWKHSLTSKRQMSNPKSHPVTTLKSLNNDDIWNSLWHVWYSAKDRSPIQLEHVPSTDCYGLVSVPCVLHCIKNVHFKFYIPVSTIERMTFPIRNVFSLVQLLWSL